MALLWPKHGPHMVLQIGSSSILINVPRDISWQISHCWVYPVATYPTKGKNMTLLWPKHSLRMVLQVGCSWILIIVPRDVPCQISHCGVYDVAPFPINGQKWPFMAKTWSLHGPQNCFYLNLNQYDQGCSMPLTHCWVYPVAPFPRNGKNIALYGQNRVLT